MSPPSDVLVIASHLPGEGHFRSERFWTIPLRCESDFDYWRGLWRLWPQPHTLILVEHDIEVTDAHVAALLDCPWPLCSWLYELHMPSGCPRGGWAQRGISGDWADRSGIGLVKVGPEARVGPLRREPWARVELAVEAAVKRPWHVHGPEVPHHHW